jgi:Phage tail protein (Tail_P2_I)
MARISFTLRKSTAEEGSSLRYDEGTFGPLTDYDSALRADSLQIAPTEFTEAFLEAFSSCYGEVDLSWQVNLTPVSELTAAPAVTDVVLVYSPLGQPQTLASGRIIVESNSTFSYSHSGLPEGRWAYYSLFLRYRSTGGDDYYERAASLQVLVPKDHGSTLMLWERIPEYYRRQDYLIGTFDIPTCLGRYYEDTPVGPLYKFLSIIGFDIDRIRTLIDYNIVSADPYESNAETLDALALQMYLPMLTNDLGDSRLRSLLNDVGYMRRSKGTMAGLELFLRAVTGGNVEIDDVTGDITMFSHRVNYVTNPKTGASVTEWRVATQDEIASPKPFYPNLNGAASGDITISGTTYTLDPGASVGVIGPLIRITSPVPVQQGDSVYLSIHSNFGTENMQWARLVRADTGASVGISTSPLVIDGVRTYEIPATNTGASVGFTNTYVEFLTDLRPTKTIDVSYLLVERNNAGAYFDGDTRRGGWLVDSASISDYRWEAAPNTSVSIYTEDYERTKKIANLVVNDMLPVNFAERVTIVSYDAVPGF